MSRGPSEVKSTRIGALARLPAFFALEGKHVVVAGGSQAAAWKAELLSAAGARVEVFAPAPGEDMLALAAAPPRGAIAIHERAWTAADFFRAAMAVADCADDHAAAQFAAAARDAGVPVNIIDRPAFSDFAFGAIVNRSPLVIGISTDGASPVFGQAIRAKIEALIPKGFARWAEAARAWRPRVHKLALSFRGRRTFWEKFTARAVAAPDLTPTEADFGALLSPPSGHQTGSVVLVGAGPGNPELLTLRAVRTLQSADVILFDDLIAPDILDFARREARKMLVGKTGHQASCRQDDINALMISLAKAGRRVVRLKGGDPMLFGRADEEIAACRAAGIAVEVVPGITAAQGAASRLLVSLTRRGQARRVQYITGHGHDGQASFRYRLDKHGRSGGNNRRLYAGKNAARIGCHRVTLWARSGDPRRCRRTGDARRRARDRGDHRRTAGAARRRAAFGAGRGADRPRLRGLSRNSAQ